MKAIKSITFPDEEIAHLLNRREIITHRVSDERKKFFVGDLVQTSLGAIYQVVEKYNIASVDDSPWLSFLTPGQIALMREFGPVAILKLHKVVVDKDVEV